jgi:hypothetical protein
MTQFEHERRFMVWHRVCNQRVRKHHKTRIPQNNFGRCSDEQLLMIYRGNKKDPANEKTTAAFITLPRNVREDVVMRLLHKSYSKSMREFQEIAPTIIN